MILTSESISVITSTIFHRKKSGINEAAFLFSQGNFIDRLVNLSEIQQKFLSRIIDECNQCTSIDEFNRTISKRNGEIQKQVFQIEQERLLYATTVIYYMMNEVYNLTDQGQMVITFKDKIENYQKLRTLQLAKQELKTRAEGGSSI